MTTATQPPAAPRVIAEIGCNHAGDPEIAEKMVNIAAHFCEVDAVKFQKRDARTLLTPEQYNAPHPNPMHAYGDTYGAHREFLELTVDEHRHLLDACASAGLAYGTSIWDIVSARKMTSMDMPIVKIPSALNTNAALLEYICVNYRSEIHVSLGMTDRAEEHALIELLDSHGRLGDTVLYSCTSGYPVPFQDICLLEISRLRQDYGGSVKAIGFSGHHLGIAADVAAQTLGAEWIERHFTLDRTMKGTDHAASLEPDGLRRLARDTRAVAKALTYKQQDILPIEAVQRDKLKWRNAG